MYQSIFDLISNALFDGATLTIMQEEIVSWFSMALSLGVVIAPFAIVFGFINILSRY